MSITNTIIAAAAARVAAMFTLESEEEVYFKTDGFGFSIDIEYDEDGELEGIEVFEGHQGAIWADTGNDDADEIASIIETLVDDDMETRADREAERELDANFETEQSAREANFRDYRAAA